MKVTKILVACHDKDGQRSMDAISRKALDDLPGGDTIVAISLDQAVTMAREITHKSITIINSQRHWHSIDRTLAKLANKRQDNPVVIFTGDAQTEVMLARIVVVCAKAERLLEPPKFLVDLFRSWTSWSRRMDRIEANIKLSRDLYASNIAKERTCRPRIVGVLPA